MQRRIERLRDALSQRESRLLAQHPMAKLRVFEPRLRQLGSRLVKALRRSLRDKSEKLGACVRELNAISPLGTLERGYSITTLSDGSVVTTIDQVTIDTELTIRLSKGLVKAAVTEKQES